MVQKNNRLPIVERDEWLTPVEAEIDARYRRYTDRFHALAGTGTLSDFANGYKWFGFQRDETLGGWWFREWLPEAFDVFLLGDFNGWQRTELRLEKGSDGVWSIFLPDAMYADRLTHGSLYKMHVHGANGWHDRIPAYARRVVQDDDTKDFTAQFWNPAQEFDWGDDGFSASKPLLRGCLNFATERIFDSSRMIFASSERGVGVPTASEEDVKSTGAEVKRPNAANSKQPLIYEAHIGMAQEMEGVGTYAEFTAEILPRIAAEGYNTLQLMAIAEHPYYGSFGYHVSNFFAVSSRSGTPEDLKALIKRAHELGIAVVMDIVHAHYVKNLNEGLAELDGSDHLYSKPGAEGYQPHWDSLLFDYGKTEVTHFLLSNVKFWLDEFHFDGFRFDGVTSMIYHHHGYTEFDSRDKFFGSDVNTDALTYLTLANRLVHEFRPEAITIAEDVSGMPGMAIPIADGGVGFDYRLAMAIPDFWIRMLKEVPDEQWNVWEIWNILTDRLPGVGTVAYAESHDQALVGDKTIAFRLMDKEMYSSMERDAENLVVERGMALHKMIRLVTIAAGGNAWLNFMGNEFGHPEWIDFPREGNGWSYAHARRQWSLADNPFLRYSELLAFDGVMLSAIKQYAVLQEPYPYRLTMDASAQTMAFSRGGLVFVFNWHPTLSIPDYTVEVPSPGRYRLVFSTDETRFGGAGRQTLPNPADHTDPNDPNDPANDADPANSATDHFTHTIDGHHYIKVYNTSRTASAFTKID